MTASMNDNPLRYVSIGSVLRAPVTSALFLSLFVPVALLIMPHRYPDLTGISAVTKALAPAEIPSLWVAFVWAFVLLYGLGLLSVLIVDLLFTKVFGKRVTEIPVVAAFGRSFFGSILFGVVGIALLLFNPGLFVVLIVAFVSVNDHNRATRRPIAEWRQSQKARAATKTGGPENAD